MCKTKRYKGTSNTRIDKCMKDCIHTLEVMSSESHIKTVACCCGHGKYPMTIVVKNKSGWCWDLISGIDIPRKRNFYKRDSEGYYYIPEVVEKMRG